MLGLVYLHGKLSLFSEKRFILYLGMQEKTHKELHRSGRHMKTGDSPRLNSPAHLEIKMPKGMGRFSDTSDFLTCR